MTKSWGFACFRLVQKCELSLPHKALRRVWRIWAYVFEHNSAIYGPILMKFCMEYPETIIYRFFMWHPIMPSHRFRFFWPVMGSKRAFIENFICLILEFVKDQFLSHSEMFIRSSLLLHAMIAQCVPPHRGAYPTVYIAKGLKWKLVRTISPTFRHAIWILDFAELSILI